MARLHGKICQFQIAAAAVTGIGSWTVDAKGETADTTGFDSAGVKEFIAGLTEWTMSFEGAVDNAAGGLVAGAGHLAVGATVTAKPYIDAAKFYTGSAIVTSVSVKAGVNGALTWSAQFQGTGVLTYPV
jgi:predicted secreted protein